MLAAQSSMEISSALRSIPIRNCGKSGHAHFDFIVISFPGHLFNRADVLDRGQNSCRDLTEKTGLTFLQGWSVYLPLTCFWNRFFNLFFFFLIRKPALGCDYPGSPLPDRQGPSQKVTFSHTPKATSRVKGIAQTVQEQWPCQCRAPTGSHPSPGWDS